MAKFIIKKSLTFKAFEIYKNSIKFTYNRICPDEELIHNIKFKYRINKIKSWQQINELQNYYKKQVFVLASKMISIGSQ